MDFELSSSGLDELFRYQRNVNGREYVKETCSI